MKSRFRRRGTAVTRATLADAPAAPSVPRGHALAERAFLFGERCMQISVDFGGSPPDELQEQVDDVLASLSVER
jgi:hypothetical protein